MSHSNSIEDIVRLRFYKTHAHQCSYLADRQATTLFLDPKQEITSSLYDFLSDLGFRRSGQNLYRPYCENCSACLSSRIPVEAFSPSRQQRKIYNRNQDLQVIPQPAHFVDEHYQLYAKYIHQRHPDGDMYPADESQYQGFLVTQKAYAFLYEFRLHGKLLAVAAVDHLHQGLSATYTFYDPDPKYQRRSLGTYAILWQLAYAHQLRLSYVYLGYWIAECRKMAYKSSFYPLEVLRRPHEWVRQDEFIPLSDLDEDTSWTL
ncbi:arginine-tRNA-protein transferase [Allopseudospirillum japonicum]|uniref:Aspartate/glutamate leucyltransferase n=1 Tax=Allopseudospirillum japonicum TaxID=64971 RepID=A0A1H6T1G8_9GAMM|nr:arginyltransferase [Allopseudospirillum japonicum]SEI71964.1 arginine-tRNA-protein transferase [Allopseudospirillum japonicum]